MHKRHKTCYVDTLSPNLVKSAIGLLQHNVQRRSSPKSFFHHFGSPAPFQIMTWKQHTKDAATSKTSEFLKVVSGVPQGSVLGPLLFVIYVDGISSVILEEASAILFADGMALYRPIHTPLDYELLQKDIDAITRWISAIHMQFNGQKCKFMVFSRKHSIDAPPVTLSIDGIPLQKAEAYNYLGDFLTSYLNWSFHINTKLKSLLVCFIVSSFQPWMSTVVYSYTKLL